VQELGSLGLKLAGSDEQKERDLPRLASGEWLCAYALTESGSGSDSAAMRTTARR
jgi:alkylation response protein AidB-like acyl-CoA dehydrogenase